MMNKQERPYIFCHMETSLDGKIMGKYLWIEETNAEEDSFYALFAGEAACAVGEGTGKWNLFIW